MRAIPVEVKWHSDLSIYASERFLKEVGNGYGWIGGIDDYGELKCILPYTIIRKPLIRMVRFRVETIPLEEGFGLQDEREFLESAVQHFRTTGMDMIIPPSTNAIFRTYPKRAVAAPYGTYTIDLTQSEDSLWNDLHSKHRNVVRNAAKKGVQIRSGTDYLNDAYQLIRDTLRRSHQSFMAYKAFHSLVLALGDNIKIFVADHEGTTQACAVVPFSNYSAYYLYGGSIRQPLTGAANLLQWEAIKMFRALGVKRYDFMGVRIDPAKGSKQEGIMNFKRRFGGHLLRGYTWKYCFHSLKYAIYSLAVRINRGGDIVDHEHHKLHRA